MPASRPDKHDGIVAETARLVLRHVTRADAPFVLALLTDRDFLAHVGDRGVHDLAAAETWAGEMMPAVYAAKGIGMFAVVEREGGAPVGIAGIVDRDGLEHVDLGYAFLPAGRGKGYAREAAGAVLDWAAARDIAPVVAIVSPANTRSIAVLERLGFTAARSLRLPGAADDVTLYVRPAPAILAEGARSH